MDSKTKAEMEQIVNNAAEQAVAKAFLVLGVDTNNPLDTQKDMAALHELRKLIENPEFQADILKLRQWRKSVENIKGKSILTIVGLLIIGISSAFMLGLKDMIMGNN